MVQFKVKIDISNIQFHKTKISKIMQKHFARVKTCYSKIAPVNVKPILF